MLPPPPTSPPSSAMFVCCHVGGLFTLQEGMRDGGTSGYSRQRPAGPRGLGPGLGRALGTAAGSAQFLVCADEL